MPSLSEYLLLKSQRAHLFRDEVLRTILDTPLAYTKDLGPFITLDELATSKKQKALDALNVTNKRDVYLEMMMLLFQDTNPESVIEKCKALAAAYDNTKASISLENDHWKNLM